MKLLLALLLVTTLGSAQQTSKPTKSPHPRQETTTSQPAAGSQAQPNDTALLQAELPNLKSDLAELRSMLNVMGSQEMSLDSRSSGAFQTNRQMWQVVIARLAELTQRMDALERSQANQPPRPHPQQP